MITNTGSDASVVRIMITNSFSFETSTLAEGKPDSAGRVTFEFPLSEATLATIETGVSVAEDKRIPIYLAPGYDLEITLNASGLIAHCEGKGSEPNNYLAKVNDLIRTIVWAGGKHINKRDSASFFHQLDSLDLQLRDFHHHYIDTVDLAIEIADLLSKRNTVSVLYLKQNYEWNAGARNGFKNRKRIEAIMDEIPFDSTLLSYRVLEYATMLHMNMVLKFHVSPRKASQEEPFSEAPAPEFAIDTKIENGEFSPELKTFLKAKNIAFWLTAKGITPPVDSLYREFKKRYPNSSYLPSLNKRFDMWFAIAPGQPAPDFSGNTPDGKKISLSDLKGKIVYVDVWATWCGPCVAEMPHMRKLQDRFSKNEDVAFVLISVDEKEEAWKKKIAGDMKGLGTYSIREQKQDGGSPFQKVYQISGIPRYILIDQAGKIVAAEAERPSSGDVIAAEINKLLNKKQEG
ncbi:TlpA family protein disulfide reductase [Fulvivirgaceae bacterium PWU4]|uniref:TlpA family protein disulfide reductase n=1 Tax=Chryseosolibacter histidini TaxID=2782349 RepID=A0AAP2DLX8_9BACT|nr:TlpA disulfide reductase family protein [Chryseosolibacter histidini]MBT1698735.1 TlpA family protein disulfide reductase [Chryseosolibacter histidini]